MNGRRFLTSLLVVILVLLSFMTEVFSGESVKTIAISSWLINGPLRSAMPVFHDVENINGEKFDYLSLLKFESLKKDRVWPEEGDVILWNGEFPSTWRIVETDSNVVVLQQSKDDNATLISFLAVYLDVKRFTTANLKISSFQLFSVYLDNKRIAVKSSNSNEKEPGAVSKEIDLESGKHLLFIKTLHTPDSNPTWRIEAEISIPVDWKEEDFKVTTSPAQTMSVNHLLDGERVRGVSISSDGELAAVRLNRPIPQGGSESWVELRWTKSGRLYQTFRGGNSISSIQWAPEGRRFSYTTGGKNGATLWVVDLDMGTTVPLLENIEGLGAHTWSPDGNYIFYSVTENPKEREPDLKRLDGMTDRWPWYRSRSFIYRVDLKQGTRMRLTAGRLSTDLNSISGDGHRLIFTRSVSDFRERPFQKTEFYILDLNTMEADTLFVSRWANSAQWSPDGKKLLIIGSPMAFGGIGKNLPEGMIPNDYDSQAFIYNIETGEVDPITREFDPNINQGVWSNTENCIYFSTGDRSRINIYRYDLRKRKFELIETGIDVVSQFDIAVKKRVMVYMGSGVSLPEKAYVLDLKRRKHWILSDPGRVYYEHVHFGDCEKWSFVNNRGVEIEGRIYYPPDFDPQRKYPCIVYYYGGTSPVTRDFGGRYPKELWAANGYVVYVLQPSGATGYGQSFSALHVNDWGKIVADEIIDGVKKFLAAHSFVDTNRVSCIGASYGGFMTMLLQTRTDMFAAAVAHAGISCIASYWGEGYWGYLYSATASANSFPWNRKDIYVDQSPLFNADKITTPLLLLHGTSDTNVPPGESIQLYTALKLLGREVELVEVAGQDHHILEHNKRKKWTKTIIAWFDRWLKGQPQWWNKMYPK